MVFQIVFLLDHLVNDVVFEVMLVHIVHERRLLEWASLLTWLHEQATPGIGDLFLFLHIGAVEEDDSDVDNFKPRELIDSCLINNKRVFAWAIWAEHFGQEHSAPTFIYHVLAAVNTFGQRAYHLGILLAYLNIAETNLDQQVSTDQEFHRLLIWDLVDLHNWKVPMVLIDILNWKILNFEQSWRRFLTLAL
jgi:hypothetical protein